MTRRVNADDRTLRAAAVGAAVLAAAMALYVVPGRPAVLVAPGQAVLAMILVPFAMLGGSVPTTETGLSLPHVGVLAVGIGLLSTVTAWWLRDAVVEADRPVARLGATSAALVLGVATLIFGVVGGYEFWAPIWAGLGLALVGASRAIPTARAEPPATSVRRALLLPSRPRRFLIDATVATTLVGVAIALARLYVEPWILQIPGMILYYPYFVIYIVSGGDLAAPGGGPTVVGLGSYVVVLGLLGGWLARWVRPAVADVDRSDWRLAGAATLVVGVALSALYVFLPELGILGYGSALALSATVGVGLLLVGLGLAVRERWAPETT